MCHIKLRDSRGFSKHSTRLVQISGSLLLLLFSTLIVTYK